MDEPVSIRRDHNTHLLHQLIHAVEERNDRDWRTEAACLGMNPAWFIRKFDDEDFVSQQQRLQARRTCRTCPVWEECGQCLVKHERRVAA